jgi:hypothetical protein
MVEKQSHWGLGEHVPVGEVLGKRSCDVIAFTSGC